MTVAAVLIILLSALDAVLTGLLLSQGGTELNPVINTLMERGGDGWIAVKMFLTVAGVSVLYKYNRYTALRILSLVYISVISYELVLITNLYM